MEDFPNLKFFLAILSLAALLIISPFLFISRPVVGPKTSSISRDFEIPLPVGSAKIKQKLPQISARSALVLNSATKEISFSKNPNLRFSPASTTKIMTALVSLNYYPPDKILTVPDQQIIGSSMGLLRGEQISVENLLYGLLLPSGNDAAYTLAKNYLASPTRLAAERAGGSGLRNFIDQMNKTAFSLELKNTSFTDPAGLSDDENFTTALDLANLALEALKNPLFKKIVATREKTVFSQNGRLSHNLENLNRLLWDVPGVSGVKTGFTDRAGGVLVTFLKEKDREFLIVVFKSEDRFADTKALIDWVRLTSRER